MATKRKSVTVDVKQTVLHEAGYKCGNPSCREVLTIELHHVAYLSEGGGDVAANILPLCANCHQKHHLGYIPRTSIRAWKMLLIAINEAFPRSAVDALLALDRLGELCVTNDVLLSLGSLLASDYIDVKRHPYLPDIPFGEASEVVISLSARGKLFVEGWKSGDQEKALSWRSSSG